MVVTRNLLGETTEAGEPIVLLASNFYGNNWHVFTALRLDPIYCYKHNIYQYRRQVINMWPFYVPVSTSFIFSG